MGIASKRTLPSEVYLSSRSWAEILCCAYTTIKSSIFLHCVWLWLHLQCEACSEMQGTEIILSSSLFSCSEKQYYEHGQKTEPSMTTQLKTLALSCIKGKYFIRRVSGFQVCMFAKYQAELPRESGTPSGRCAVIQPPAWPITVYQRASYSGNGSANEWQIVGRVKCWNTQESGDSYCRPIPGEVILRWAD